MFLRFNKGFIFFLANLNKFSTDLDQILDNMDDTP